ncbi:Holliday junction resolvase RecU [Metasolibacillus meyeri]|uniref:Holliday junction resolvase RecU n=1 Tax=Metasolibacillus meyeri TaxID=1071052 RepID=A0AAW9NTK0_9BACL|nr:Holliday junction resolvase RecU [Metasolibacillus meyeri]MEC1178276.1 Holliday junction resolvase RecU [Metasolibacillus meyeri]
MMIRYPNGKPYNKEIEQVQKPKKQQAIKDNNFSNRGKTLEDDLNETNTYYLQRQIATIHKKPVPIQIVKVEYPSRSAAVIREAYFRTPSTTDYNGVWNGYYLDFEAKETESKTSFPLKNIHAHQVEHMKNVIQQKGIAFFIIRFSSLDRYFITPFSIVENAWQQMVRGGRKSIPLQQFEAGAIEMKASYQPRIDYLQAVQQFISEEIERD